MNERLIVQLMMGADRLPIETRRTDGLVFAGEEDAWPRRVCVNIVPRSDTADYRMRRVRQINCWPYPEYKLQCQLRDGALVFSGVTPDGLPSGDYWFTIDIEDLRSVASRYNLYLKDDLETTLAVQVAKDPRTITFTKGQLDPQIERVIDGSAVASDWKLADWLKDDRPRVSRKACLLNVLAKLRTAPQPSEPLIQYIESVFFIGTERLYARVTPALLEELETLSRDPEKPFYKEGKPNAPIHFRLLAAANIDPNQYELISFRQEHNPSMQIVVAAPKDRHGDYFADVDIDMGNPLQDVQGLVIHMAELASNNPTDHLSLWSGLSKDRAVSPFLYYSVTA